MTHPDSSPTRGIGYQLSNNLLVKILEILVVFGAAMLFIVIMLPLAGDNILTQMGVIWTANIIMMCLVWLGNWLRGRSLDALGVSIGKASRQKIWTVFWWSLVVCISALAAFMLGAIIMANITGIPEQIDTSGYDYIKGNIPMLIVTLIGVYIVSSFGEEFVYRAFLLTRLTEMGLSSKIGKFVVVLISALIFGFAHYSWGPMGIVQTTFMGIVLALFFFKFNKNIWPLVMAHAYLDTVLIVQMFLG